AVLQALNKKADIAIGQLATLQSATASVLNALVELKTEIDLLLREQEIRNLHDLVWSAVESYTKISAVRGNYASDDDFRKAPGVLEDVRSYLERLESSTAQLKAKKAFGPTTGMVIPGAFFLEHSLLLLRGDRPRDIAARLRSSEEWL